MIRIVAKVFGVTVGLAALNIASASAVTYLATNGSGSSCTFSQPCASLLSAIEGAGDGGEILCFDATTINNPGTSFVNDVTIDCSGVMLTADQNITTLQLTGFNQEVKIRNLTVIGTSGGSSVLKVTGSGLLIIENCVIDDYAGTALDIEPTGALSLVIKNSRISNNSSGVLIKPGSGGSVTATFDGVTITNNTGGGLKTDTTNGLVSVDISNSTISGNFGNGMNAVGGAGGPAMFNIHNSVVAKNGAAGMQVNGATAAAIIDTTLLDSNASGATTVVNGGHILTYGNNRIVGSPGSGFTSTTPLQ
jgi:hypothetical protein